MVESAELAKQRQDNPSHDKTLFQKSDSGFHLQWGSNETKAKMAQTIAMSMKQRLEPLMEVKEQNGDEGNRDQTREKQVKVLDFGCGEGGITIGLSEDVGAIVGVDPSASAIKAFESKISEDGPCSFARRNTTAIQLNLLEEPLSERAQQFLDENRESFDIVVCSLTFHHIEHVDQVVSVMNALLKREQGVICVCDVLKTENSDCFHPLGPSRKHVFHLGGFSEDQVFQLLQGNGFHRINFEEFTIEKEDAETGELTPFPLFLVTAVKL